VNPNDVIAALHIETDHHRPGPLASMMTFVDHNLVVSKWYCSLRHVPTVLPMEWVEGVVG
jgi:hypothetical protein